VFYQPIVDLDSGQTKSVEALARWRHPSRGFIPPAEFIPVAEDGGLIIELGNLVLAKACCDATKMPDEIKIAVNLSATQFAKSDVVDSVIFALVDSRLHEPRLELEITESVFLADSSENIKTLQRLRKLGVAIALDDFGVGYSSLSYLTAFAFNKVKIDKSFIDRIGRPETVAVLASIVQLAKTLNLAIVAEGIETREQVEKVRALGISLGQGYFFAKPAPLTELNFEPHRAIARQAVA
jgi:EAL domain-containing protein (putative c-di-GMP-specific phosphodiesterase class I)